MDKSGGYIVPTDAVCKRGLASWDTGGILGTRYPEDTTGVLRTLVSQDTGRRYPEDTAVS